MQLLKNFRESDAIGSQFTFLFLGLYYLVRSSDISSVVLKNGIWSEEEHFKYWEVHDTVENKYHIWLVINVNTVFVDGSAKTNNVPYLHEAAISTHWGRDVFKLIAFDENCFILTKIWQKCIPMGQVNNKQAWFRKWLGAEHLWPSILTYVRVRRPWEVNWLKPNDAYIRR